MLKIVTVTEVYCTLCGFIKRVNPGYTPPEKCPSCGDNKPIQWTGGSDDKWPKLNKD